MLLGTIMKSLACEEAAASALLALGDVILMAEVETARHAHDEAVGEYVSGAAQRFARLASDEDWLRLMTAMERAENPATRCLETMLRWSIDRDKAEANGSPLHSCSCGSGSACATSGAQA